MQLAQGITNPGIGGLWDRFSSDNTGTSFLSALISTAVTIFLVVGGLYFFFQLITGAVAWIGSGGDKARLSRHARSFSQLELGWCFYSQLLQSLLLLRMCLV